MDNSHAAEALFKAPGPDERRVTTEKVFKQIVSAETAARHAKSERLKQARLDAQVVM